MKILIIEDVKNLRVKSLKTNNNEISISKTEVCEYNKELIENLKNKNMVIIKYSMKWGKSVNLKLKVRNSPRCRIR